MVGRIVALVCCLLCAFPFFVISVYNKDSSEPINFWSGDTSLKDKEIGRASCRERVLVTG